MSIFKNANRELRDSGLWREQTTVSSPPSRFIIRDGKKVLNFASNNYLGLAGQADSSAFLAYGSGGSRLICGTSDESLLLESTLANWGGYESALMFSSGYQCNVGVLQALGELDVHIFSDSLNHASLIDGCRLAKAPVSVFPHNDYAALESLLKDCDKRPVIVSETIFSMDGDVANLDAIAALKKQYGALIVLDEAHAVGLFDGIGLSDGNVADIFLGTMSKSIGWHGGFVAGSNDAIHYFRHKARSFMFSTAPSAQWNSRGVSGVKQTIAANEQRENLWANCGYFAEISSSKVEGPIFPVHTPNPMRAAASLLEQGFWVQPIRYPTVPRGTERLRIALSASHTKEDLTKLNQLISEF